MFCFVVITALTCTFERMFEYTIENLKLDNVDDSFVEELKGNPVCTLTLID